MASAPTGVSAKVAAEAPLRPVTPAGILASRLQDLSADLEPEGLSAELMTRVRDVVELAVGLVDYPASNTSAPSPALTQLAEQTRKQNWSSFGGGGLEAEMLSGHLEGQLLGFLVAMTGATRVLEVGMFTGYSALAMAEVLPADGHLVACEINAEVSEFARRCFDASPAGDRITIRVGPALESLQQMGAAGEQFDLIFIDADKGGYSDYVEAVVSVGLLAKGATIAVDNTMMQGEPWSTADRSHNGEAIAEFNQCLQGDPRWRHVLLPVRDGLTLIRMNDG